MKLKRHLLALVLGLAFIATVARAADKKPNIDTVMENVSKGAGDK